MQFLEKEISQLMTTIWVDFLGLEIHRTPEEPPANGDQSYLSSCVHVTGAWEGMVTLRCPADLAREAARVMFSTPLDQVSEEQTLDALAELTNMTGGNLKALMQPPCHISLPILTEHTHGPLRIPGSSLLSEVAFKAAGYDFVVAILERTSKAAEPVQR